MAFALITSLLNTIELHFVQPLPCLILDDREMIESLCKKLRFLQAFLEESKENINNQARRVLETEIRDVALDVEGKIESELREVYLWANDVECSVQPFQSLYWTLQRVMRYVESKLRNNFHLWANEDVERPVNACQSLYQTLHQVILDIESIERRIQIESNRKRSVEPQRRNTTEISKAGSFSECSTEPKNVMVGCNDELNTIMHKLISHSKDREVISIVGIGGIGKTTLVRRVYEDASIISHFDTRAWTTVSQEHNLREMLLVLLGSIVEITDKIEKGDNSYLKTLLRQKLIGHRYLIVIDDKWSTKAWDDIHKCFPEEESSGSRILLTTRLKQVADYASSGNNPHYMRFLDPDESWNLFYKKVFEEKKFPDEFETVGRGIVDKFHGLPLTIVVVAGILTSFNKSSLNLWGSVTENLNSLLSMDPEEKCSKILSLSYNYLPPHLKVCFLYFGVFREDSEICVKKLIWLWVAEGFLKPELNKTVEEVAEAYLQDLIDRGLVQIDWRRSDGKIKSCRLHDLLHSLCSKKAHRENLLYVINKDNVQAAKVPKSHGDRSRSMSTALDPKACRWISNQLSHLHWPIARAWYESHTSDEFRSILYFPEGFAYTRSSEPFPCFKLLRVLDIASIVVLNVIPSGIVDLVNLRYLALRTDASLKNFQWFKLRSLQTFIVRFYRGSWLWGSPPDILDMPRLRHVQFTKASSLYLPKLVQGNLRTVSWLNLPHHMRTKPDFKKIPNVKELGIYTESVLGRVLLPPDSLDGLADLRQLENLKIVLKSVGYTDRPRPTGDFGLPTTFPPNLKKLTLDGTYLPWENMAIIGTLRSLEVLKLKWFAFCGPEWKTTENGFCRLKHLQIKVSDLKRWSANADHFPVLEHLILASCMCLEEIPPDFDAITTLQLIELSPSDSSVISSAKRIQEERLNLGDDKLIVRHLN